MVSELPFCYFCGELFVDGDEVDSDHVPPKAIFATDDRDFPLKLKSHKKCNASQKDDDEVLGQLISIIHGRIPKKRNNKLGITVHQDANDMKSTTGIFQARDIAFLMRRWIKGFHAALYGVPLSDKTEFAIQPPLPSGKLADGAFVVNPILSQHYAFVECIKRNRASGNLDVVITNNEKLRYECVWDKLSNGDTCCVFAINLYDWKDLGDGNNFDPRGCAGLYCDHWKGRPTNASSATDLLFVLKNIDKADPFAV